MVPYLKEVVKMSGELSIDEQNLFAVAYQNGESRGIENHVAAVRGCHNEIENDLEKIRRDILDLLDRSLIPNTGTGKSKALYYKMCAYFNGLPFLKPSGLTCHISKKGDYNIYLAEFTSGERCNVAVTSAYKASKFAQVYGKKETNFYGSRDITN
ncbi:14-3-3 domain-containing protein [Dactylonectria estremocensis]|uniref:14-3-3 domain-containing protein n=1 Tax=Dactylonectria estremocensis TaxID=1079267 RepID=A0A9P9FCT5_9HYPO|nr:14-3-3 domain-containing protein [Dactylonectria estremocensis]